MLYSARKPVGFTTQTNLLYFCCCLLGIFKMTGKLHSPTMALALVLFGLLLVGVHSHGSLTVPRSRNVINPIQGQAWWKDHGNGHGGSLSAAGPKPINGPGESTAPCAPRASGVQPAGSRTYTTTAIQQQQQQQQ